MKRYEPDDTLVSMYVRLRHETLPMYPPAGDVLSAGWELGARISPPADRDWERLLDLIACPGAPSSSPSGAPRGVNRRRVGEAALLMLAGVAGGAMWSGVFLVCWNLIH
jgi:hypothetical protein